MKTNGIFQINKSQNRCEKLIQKKNHDSCENLMKVKKHKNILNKFSYYKNSYIPYNAISMLINNKFFQLIITQNIDSPNLPNNKSLTPFKY